MGILYWILTVNNMNFPITQTFEKTAVEKYFFPKDNGFLPDMGNLERLLLSYNIYTFCSAEWNNFEENTTILC